MKSCQGSLEHWLDAKNTKKRQHGGPEVGTTAPSPVTECTSSHHKAYLSPDPALWGQGSVSFHSSL